MCDVLNGLVVVSVAAFALGLILVMAGLVPPPDSQETHYPLMLGPRSRDTPTMPWPRDLTSSRSDRRTHARATRSNLHAPTFRSRLATPPPADSAHQECGGPDHDFTRCAYIRDSASVAHGYLVPRPSGDKVY